MSREYMITLKWVAAFVIAIWISLGATVQLLIIMMALDYITGIAHSIVERKLDSSIGFRGLIKKFMMFLIIYVCHKISEPFGIHFDLGEVVGLAYVFNEVLSILENCHRIGVPIPDVVTGTMAKIRKKSEEIGDISADIKTTSINPIDKAKGKQIEELSSEIKDLTNQGPYG